MALELDKDTVIKWRQFTGTKHFDEGIAFLRSQHAPKRTGTDIPAMIEHAAKWSAYMEALDDLTDVICHVENKQKDLDEGPLER